MSAATMTAAETEPARKAPLYTKLYFQVCVAIVAGVLVGWVYPTFGANLRPLAEGFIRLIKMLLAPVIFGTVVLGIAKMESMREVGRIGLKAFIYFEVVSTLALLIGLAVANVVKPGAGMNIDPATIDASAIAAYTRGAASQEKGVAAFLLNIIPTSVADSFVRNDMLQIILFAVLLGVAMSRFPQATRPLVPVLEAAMHALFTIVGLVMRLAPIGAFGAMAFMIGKYGVGSLASLGKLMAALYLTCFVFVIGVLGLIIRLCGFSLWRFLRYIRDEIVIVLATSSSESVLPRMMAKMENLGCAKPVVGLVLPSGYTFNPDGTAIYLTMASIFIAQATNTPLTLGDQLVVLLVLMLTSKGSAGVAGAGFVTLAATLASLDKIPVAGMVLLLGVDRFLSEARAVTNVIGNGIATIAVAHWEKAIDRPRAERVLAGLPVPALAPAA